MVPRWWSKTRSSPRPRAFGSGGCVRAPRRGGGDGGRPRADALLSPPEDEPRGPRLAGLEPRPRRRARLRHLVPGVGARRRVRRLLRDPPAPARRPAQAELAVHVRKRHGTEGSPPRPRPATRVGFDRLGACRRSWRSSTRTTSRLGGRRPEARDGGDRTLVHDGEPTIVYCAVRDCIAARRPLAVWGPVRRRTTRPSRSRTNVVGRPLMPQALPRVAVVVDQVRERPVVPAMNAAASAVLSDQSTPMSAARPCSWARSAGPARRPPGARPAPARPEVDDYRAPAHVRERHPRRMQHRRGERAAGRPAPLGCRSAPRPSPAPPARRPPGR